MWSAKLPPVILAFTLTVSAGGRAQSTLESVEQGLHALEDHRFEAAARIFLELVQREPSAANFGYLASAEAAAGRFDKAIHDFQRSIELGNDSAGVRYQLGVAYLKAQRLQEAIEQFRRVVAQIPEFPGAQKALGVALLDSGRPREAIPYLGAARQQGPPDPRLWADLARAEFEAGESKTAIDTTDVAVRAFQDDSRLALTLALLCLHHAQVQKARHLLENASEIAPEDSAVKVLLAQTSLLAGEPIETLAVLKEVPPGFGRPGEVAFLRGIALALTGKSEAARTEFASAARADPRNVKYLVMQAWLGQWKGQVSESLAILDRAHKLDSRTPVIPYRAAVSHYFAHHYAQARKLCQEAIRLDTLYSPGYYLLGIINLETGDLGTAKAMLQRALALHPDYGGYHRELGRAFLEAETVGEGKEQLDEALRLNPKDAEAYFWRATCSTKQGERKQAIDDLETAVALDAKFTEAYRQLARLYLAEGNDAKTSIALAAARAGRKPEDERKIRLLQLEGQSVWEHLVQ